MKPKLGLWGIIIVIAAIVSVASVAGTYVYLQTYTRQKLVIATTTSLYDTGLLDQIQKDFEAKYPIDVYFISVGSGVAIQFAQRGDADMLLVHAPSEEFKFLNSSYGVNRKIFAYNFFEIVGPKNDPAQIQGSNVTAALQKIALAGNNSLTKWVSRGDASGTNVKEQALWLAAGFDYAKLKLQTNWFKVTGTGMGNTLVVTNNYPGYTLTDLGTFLAYTNGTTNQLPNLKPIVTEGEDLLNVYSAIAVSPLVNPKANFEAATTLTKYLISTEGQQLIGNYGVSTYGQALFFPTVDLIKKNTDPQMVQMIKNYAYFDGSECPPQFRYGHPELYS